MVRDPAVIVRLSTTSGVVLPPGAKLAAALLSSKFAYVRPPICGPLVDDSCLYRLPVWKITTAFGELGPNGELPLWNTNVDPLANIAEPALSTVLPNGAPLKFEPAVNVLPWNVIAFGWLAVSRWATFPVPENVMLPAMAAVAPG